MPTFGSVTLPIDMVALTPLGDTTTPERTVGDPNEAVASTPVNGTPTFGIVTEPIPAVIASNDTPTA